MNDYVRPIALCAALATTVACQGQIASPDGRDLAHATDAIEETPPTVADAARATYWGGLARQVTLADGEFRGPEGQQVRLLREHYVAGDLEGDGAVDAAVILSAVNAGPETGHYVAVVRHVGTDTVSLGTAFLGHPAQVQRLSIDGRRVVVDLTRPSAADPATMEPVRVAFELRTGGLVKVMEGAP